MSNRWTNPQPLDAGEGRVSIWYHADGNPGSILLWPADDTMDTDEDYAPWVEIPLDEFEDFIAALRKAIEAHGSARNR